MTSLPGPVWPTATTPLRPLPLDAVVLGDGMLGRLQRENSTTSIPTGEEHLADAGAWVNYENCATHPQGFDGPYNGPVYEDGEAYKWLEAAAWDAGRSAGGNPGLLDLVARRTALVAAAQAPDGYLNTFVQLGGRPERYGRLDVDHEIFNNGALIQSAVAQFRATGRRALLDVARRVADHLEATFGPAETQRTGTCGHPVAEMALVELYRTTGERRYLDLARYFVDVRGHGVLAPDHCGRQSYLSDRVPVRETTSPEGHAVRAVYLAAGATDVAVEDGDATLLAQLQDQWQAMVETKTYLTGGLGSRWEGESFGDPYELPADRAYAETCAAIASIQWSYRLLLATGEAKYADLVERQFYNAVLPGVSLSGDRYFYVNTLQVRADSDPADEREPAGGRQPWFHTSCCPTNLMRTLASLQTYVATRSADGVQLHQYTTSTVRTDLDAGAVDLEVDTAMPWDGDVTVTVRGSTGGTWTLGLRVPSWADGAAVRVGDAPDVPVTPGSYVDLRREWEPGDVVHLTLPTTPVLVDPHPRVDGVRGCVAVRRGPLVHTLEQVDLPDDVLVDDVTLVGTTLRTERDPDLFDGVLGPVPVVVADGRSATGAPVALRLVPYFAWDNRGTGPMRVWIPFSD